MMKLPAIFVIENNFQQQGIAMATVTPTKTLADYTKGLGVPSYTIDGNDIASVYATNEKRRSTARGLAADQPSSNATLSAGMTIPEWQAPK